MSSAFRRTRGGIPAGGSTSSLSPEGTSRTAPSPSPSSSLLVGYQGVKAWTGGIHLTSVGLKDMDVIVGGGQPLGTCMWIQQDRWCVDLALSLVKYWTAEALSQGQCLMIPVKAENKAMLQENEPSEFGWDETSPQPQGSALFPSHQDVTNLLQSLPSNLHWEKQKKREEHESSSEQTVAGRLESLEILEEEEEEDEEKETDKGLKVAWQYKLSVQRERLGLNNDHKIKASAASAHNTTSTNVYCHSYNLSGRMNDQRSIAVDSCVVAVEDTEYPQLSDARRGMSLFQDLSARIRNATSDGQPKVIRLLFFHTDLAMLTVALPLLLVWIRKESLPVVIMICSKPTSDPKIWSALSKSADVVMSTEGFASRNEYPPPPEFRNLQGLLTLWKLATVTAATANGGGHFADLTTSKRPAAYIYGFKRDHRKLHIPLLHIPPEDYAEGGGSVGSGVRSGAGRPASDITQPRQSHATPSTGCASNTAGSVLDF